MYVFQKLLNYLKERENSELQNPDLLSIFYLKRALSSIANATIPENGRKKTTPKFVNFDEVFSRTAMMQA